MKPLSQNSSGQLLRGAQLLAITSVGILLSCNAMAADTVWQLVGAVEKAVPFSEDSVEEAIEEGLKKIEQGSPPSVAYRATTIRLKNRSIVHEVLWTPKTGKSPSTVTLTFPAVAARTEWCLSRADISQQYGAPARSWTSKVGDVGYTHFEFAEPKYKVSVAFSDVTNCLVTLTVEEGR